MTTYSKQEINRHHISIARSVQVKYSGKMLGFLRERTNPVFIADRTVLLRSLTAKDEEFYVAVREQYSIFHKGLTMAQLTDN